MLSVTIKPLISTEWLHNHLHDEDVRVIDASWHMPSSERNGLKEWNKEAISGAMFFDIEAVSDTHSDYPHMLPSAKVFAEALTTLGIENHHHIIVYDGAGLFSAARLWWMLRHFGHEKISVLDGGLPAWKAMSYKTEQGAAPRPSANPYKIENNHRNLFVSKEDVSKAIEEGSHSIFDARGAARFHGTAAEPRVGMRSGHMRGAVNIPYTTLLNDNGTMKPQQELETLFPDTQQQPIITSCGSGITACILSLALEMIGKDSQVYDGSWAEWGRSDDVEVVTT